MVMQYVNILLNYKKDATKKLSLVQYLLILY
jgi:hypothetical protein